MEKPLRSPRDSESSSPSVSRGALLPRTRSALREVPAAQGEHVGAVAECPPTQHVVTQDLRTRLPLETGPLPRHLIKGLMTRPSSIQQGPHFHRLSSREGRFGHSEAQR